MFDLVWQPIVSPLHVAAGAAALVVLAVVAYGRMFRAGRAASAALLVCRLLVIAVLSLLLLGPSRVPESTQQAGRPRMTVLVDSSQSMLTADVAGQSRIAHARDHWLTAERLQRLADVYDLQLLTIDKAVAPITADEFVTADLAALARGRESLLADNLQRVLLDLPVSGDGSTLLLFSDGHDSNDRALAEVAPLAKARGAVVHTVALGGPTVGRDLALSAVAEQDFLLAGEEGSIAARVYQVGLDTTETTLSMRTEDGAQRTFDIRFDDKPFVEIDLPVKETEPGHYAYELDVAPAEGERETGNNRQTVFLEVTDEHIRVLLLEGQPFWDTKFLAQSLRGDARIELTHITQLSQRRQKQIVTRVEQSQATVPASAEDLAYYDVVILGRGIEHFLSADFAHLLADFVQTSGGHLVFARGRAYDPDTPTGRLFARELAPLEPVVFGRGLVHQQKLTLTPDGVAHPALRFEAFGFDGEQLFASMPGFDVMSVVTRAKATASVLARVAAGAGPYDPDAAPALVSMRVGRGTVLAVLGEGLWRWNLLPPGLEPYLALGDAPWPSLRVDLQMAGYLPPSERVSPRLDRSTVPLGEKVTVDVAMKYRPSDDYRPTVRITGPDDASHDLALRSPTPGGTRLVAEFEPSSAGVYTIHMTAAARLPHENQR